MSQAEAVGSPAPSRRARRSAGKAGPLAAWCASAGVGLLFLIPWLVYVAAIAAVGLFTVVVWCAAWSVSRVVHPRVVSWAAAAVLAGAATWVFWQIDDLAYWYVVPAVSGAGALAVERRSSWGVAVVGSVLYAASFSWF